MAKTKISEYNATAGSNTDVDGININEGCSPAGINNAIREVMAHLKDFQAGNVSGNALAVASGGTGGETASSARTNLGLGTISTQESDNVSVTGGSVTGLTTLGFDSNWTVAESGGVLYFAYGGTNKAKLDSSGNLTVVGNVTAYGTV